MERHTLSPKGTAEVSIPEWGANVSSPVSARRATLNFMSPFEQHQQVNHPHTGSEDDTLEETPLTSGRVKAPIAADNVIGGGVPVILVAGATYCLTSASLILLNKHALASFDFQCPISLLCFHCTLAVTLVKVCELVGLIRLEPLRWSIVRIWFPANVLFVSMIVTSFYSLQLIGVGMFTVLKNLTNFMTIAGDYWFFHRTYNLQVWVCLMLMVVSALCGGLTDLRFSAEGYAWQIINCAFTSAYALYLSGVMSAAAQHTGDRERLSEFSMVYYNNLLSVPPLLLLAVLRGEVQLLGQQPALSSPQFLVVAALGGLLGFGISFTSLWYVSRTTATIYSLTGSLNKVLVAGAGVLLFHESTSLQNLGSIGMGLAAGVVFVLAKSVPTNDGAVPGTGSAGVAKP